MKWIIICFITVLCSCSTEFSNPLHTVLSSTQPAIKTVMDTLEKHEVQIIYSQIDSSATGEVVFTDYTFQLHGQDYFYPASTVKLPAAVLALELADNSASFDINTSYHTTRDSLLHTISDDVRQIFAVSDNEAYNRLYELLGRTYINSRLNLKGIGPLRIAHRLSTSNSAAPMRGGIQFSGDSIPAKLYEDDAIATLDLFHQSKGIGFLRNDSLVAKPMDFSRKNYFPLEAQHDLMKRLFFPNNFTEHENFKLSEETRTFLLKQMHTLPRNNGYDETEYYDSYGKFFIYGDSKDRIPEHINIYNKVGYAYGTLTDTAYIVDEKEGVQFLVSGTILVNENGIFNDNVYEYDSIGMPFLAALGRELYSYELEREQVLFWQITHK